MIAMYTGNGAERSQPTGAAWKETPLERNSALAARETVRQQVEAIRERIAMGDDSPERLIKVVNKCALGLFSGIPAIPKVTPTQAAIAWEEMELLARLLADVAGLLQQKEKPL